MRSAKNRWNTVGRTRTKLAAKLTEYMRSIVGKDDQPRFPGVTVAPEDIHPMRLAGAARAWEDAHSWEAHAKFESGVVAKSLYSYNTMTECARAQVLYPVGKDGELSI